MMRGKTLQMPVLRDRSIYRQRHTPHQDPGRPDHPALQVLRSKVHTEASATPRWAPRNVIKTNLRILRSFTDIRTPSIIELGNALLAAVRSFAAHAREYYYVVAISGDSCPRCGGSLVMEREGRCRCRACKSTFDPTITLQSCSSCGGNPRIRIRRYECRQCGQEIISRFLFDRVVFDAAYFREKMAVSRRRKKEQRQRLLEKCIADRSPDLPTQEVDLHAVPGLVDALDNLTAGLLPLAVLALGKGFDLKRYQSHIRAHSRPIAISLDEIPALDRTDACDRIWRFIAIIFLAHAGEIRMWQEGTTIWVIKHETHGKRQGVPRSAAATHGIQGPLGRVEA